jgi:glycosyltransferase involved in cell wall biosynthesis
MPYFSLIIPVYNRPEEIRELLESLTQQTNKDFEVVVVEDGSTDDCKQIVESFCNKLNVRYFFKENSGPGQSRNYGAERSSGKYFIVLDSDCIIPPDYIENILQEINADPKVDAFGGPDRALDSFTPVQKAINYAMTSFFTTGGIRGGKKKLDKFYPRSFNMGIRKEVYRALGGFSKMRFGEDIDFSIRLYKNSFSVKLFPSAYVYHKRRTDWKKFYKQVFNSGIARINLYKLYPDSLKLVHLLPSVFVLFAFACVVSAFFCIYALLPLFLWVIIIFIDSAVKNKSLRIAFLSIIASFMQLFGYGMGFISAVWNLLVLKKDKYSAFERNFYK